MKRWALARYAAVGAVATAAHWAVLVALVEAAGLAAWVASGVGAVVGAQVAYVGNRRFTFGHVAAGAGHAVRTWTRFMGTALLGAGVGMAIVALGVGLGVHYLLAQAVATASVMLLTFAVNRAWTFVR